MFVKFAFFANINFIIYILLYIFQKQFVKIVRTKNTKNIKIQWKKKGKCKECLIVCLLYQNNVKYKIIEFETKINVQKVATYLKPTFSDKIFTLVVLPVVIWWG